MPESAEIGSIKPVRNSSKSFEVFEALRIAILSRKLSPGDALKEAHIARQMQVSQVPVREALLQLENLGLVCRVPDKGTTVTRLSPTEMRELVAVRAHLEDLAFCLAAQHITPEMEKALRRAGREIARSVSVNDYYAAGQADLNFHRIVWHASGNRILERTLERLCVSFYAFVSMQRRQAGERLKESISRHDILIDALLSRKPAKISAAIHAHINEKSSLPSHLFEE